MDHSAVIEMKLNFEILYISSWAFSPLTSFDHHCPAVVEENIIYGNKTTTRTFPADQRDDEHSAEFKISICGKSVVSLGK